MKPTLLILAAGMGSRYGGLKQVDAIGPNGEAIIEYSIFDAIRAGFGKVVFVIRKDIEDAFKEKFANKFDDKIEIKYVFQAIDSPIEGIDEFPPREKPWGTAHAVLVAKDVINEPFAVINADDYYGITAFETMANFLANDCTPSIYSMIGYVLKNTLSDHGSVNRGVCEMDAENFLIDIAERLKIERMNGVPHYLENEERFPVSEDSLVSMNFFGFHQNVFDAMHTQFLDFVKANSDKPRAEFFIPLVVSEQIKAGAIKMKVLQNDEQWYGVTYQQDKIPVQNAFSRLIEQERYPAALWG